MTRFHNRTRRLIRSLLVLIALANLLDSTGRVVSGEQPPVQPKIGPEVVEALRARGAAQVMVSLIESPALINARTDLPRLRSIVATVQEDVLGTLVPGDFRLKERYRAVPALAGAVLSEAGLARLAAHPSVRRVDLDAGGSGGLAQSVPHIGANTFHIAGIRGQNVVVAVLDSGLDTDHPDLAGALVHQACFLDYDGIINGIGYCPNGSDRQTGAGSAEDNAGHGTHVSGIVASRGSVSASGVAPGASIVALKVTTGPSYSGLFYYFSEITAALDYLINNPALGVKIINMSLGTNALFAGSCDNAVSWTQAGAAAINTLRANGVIAFASAGNNFSGTYMTAPACIVNVVSVGAANNLDVVASYSNSNSTTDVFAPGDAIASDAIGGGTMVASGTSMASPHAAGCAALLLQSSEATTPAQMETRLKSSSYLVTDTTNGLTFPRIDCRAGRRILLPLLRR